MTKEERLQYIQDKWSEYAFNLESFEWLSEKYDSWVILGTYIRENSPEFPQIQGNTYLLEGVGTHAHARSWGNAEKLREYLNRYPYLGNDVAE